MHEYKPFIEAINQDKNFQANNTNNNNLLNYILGFLSSGLFSF